MGAMRGCGWIVMVCLLGSVGACDTGPTALEQAIADQKAEEKKKKEIAAKAQEEWDKYGSHMEKIRELKKKLDQEPCDRPKSLKLSQTLFQAGAYREAAGRVQTFHEKCGDFPRLRWVSYESYKAISEWNKAEVEANILIEHDSNDKDYWWWRGFVREQKKEWEGAASDYQQSLSLVPQLNSIPFNLADVYEKMGKPCEAIFPLEQFLHYHPDIRNIGKVRRRIQGLYAKAECANLAGTGSSATLRMPKDGGVIQASVKVNGKRSKLLVDTGASYVALRREKAEAWGLSPDGKKEVLINTANGIVTGTLVMVDEVALGSLKAKRVPAILMENLPEGVDGLLGMSFLSRYKVEMDPVRRKFKIMKR